LDYVLADYLNNLDALPQFVDASQNDYHLGYGSPCINSGSPDTTGLHLPPSDLDDKPRVFNNRIDMGCYESDGITALFPELTDYDNNGPNIFPNPTSGKINIKGFDNIKIEQICVMTFSGMIIEQIMVDSFNGSVSIDLSDKPKGLYFVKIKTCNGIITEKVILK
jgi:hypothetical protein